jgi:hypothetical protein
MRGILMYYFSVGFFFCGYSNPVGFYRVESSLNRQGAVKADCQIYSTRIMYRYASAASE